MAETLKSVWSGSALFANYLFGGLQTKMGLVINFLVKLHTVYNFIFIFFFFLCNRFKKEWKSSFCLFAVFRALFLLFYFFFQLVEDGVWSRGLDQSVKMKLHEILK